MLQFILATMFLLVINYSFCTEPTGIRHFRYIYQCNVKCAGPTPAVNVQKCCVANKAGNWGTCTKLNQAICARMDVKWSENGDQLCSFYGFGFECMDRFQLGGS
ncbi:unnamed protein product, partial [Mesorhabditis belari]|uniref:Uncharacterized protein n=1 Tax=Mesorhabditis belari TaxID=2138241 RepID=A0AAF3EGU3_9BILA